MNANPADVTIAVCTYNRADRLETALRSLRAIALPTDLSVEILVVDNASTDETSLKAETLSAEAGVPIRYAFEGQQGVAYARNRALQESGGKWVAFFDDDQLADRNWLIELLQGAERRHAVCVGGAVRLRLPDDRPLANACRILLSETPASAVEAPYRGPRTPGAGNLLLDRVVAIQAGGFDPHATMGGEDTALYRQLQGQGYEAWFAPLAIIEHVVPASRLGEDYLVWNAQRTGTHVADIERRHYGAVAFYPWFFVRLAQAAIRGPKLVWRLRQSNQAADRLGARCVIAAAGGYARRALRICTFGIVKFESYFDKLDFRDERARFGT